MRIADLIERFGGELEGEGTAEVTGLTGVEFAGPSDATFALTESVLNQAEASPACCVIVRREMRASRKPLIRCGSPESYAADLLEFFHPAPQPVPGVHPSAQVDDRAQVPASATIGPNVVVAAGCRLGERVCLMASVVVAADCQIGDETTIHPNVTVYPRCRIGARVLIHAGAVIGADGFGFFVENGRLRKWPHVGNVVIEDEVEIGANACIDRAKYGSTLIQSGAKIDNLVQVAHNCQVGHGAILAGQVGLSGSVVLEDGVICGGQVGIGDHITIGRGAQLSAQAGVISDIPAGSVSSGFPAKPRRQTFAESAMLGFLTEHRNALRKLVREASKS